MHGRGVGFDGVAARGLQAAAHTHEAARRKRPVRAGEVMTEEDGGLLFDYCCVNGCF